VVSKVCDRYPIDLDGLCSKYEINLRTRNILCWFNMALKILRQIRTKHLPEQMIDPICLKTFRLIFK
jgi:hypothetical protein